MTDKLIIGDEDLSNEIDSEDIIFEYPVDSDEKQLVCSIDESSRSIEFTTTLPVEKALNIFIEYLIQREEHILNTVKEAYLNERTDLGKSVLRQLCESIGIEI